MTFHALGTNLKRLPFVAPPKFAADQPRRKSLPRPRDQGTFVLPIKQSFVKDARIMPGTMRLLTLLAGWKGNQKGMISTTQVILGRHLHRSTRQIYRYLQDATEEGYLLYCYVKNKLGQIIGTKIWLNTLAIRRKTTPPKKNGPARPRKPDQTLMSDSNDKDFNIKDIDPDLWDRLEKFRIAAGFKPIT